MIMKHHKYICHHQFLWYPCLRYLWVSSLSPLWLNPIIWINSLVGIFINIYNNRKWWLFFTVCIVYAILRINYSGWILITYIYHNRKRWFPCYCAYRLCYYIRKLLSRNVYQRYLSKLTLYYRNGAIILTVHIGYTMNLYLYFFTSMFYHIHLS